jgi:teichuronic acid biosynthesis glycosyltransferase TuaG
MKEQPLISIITPVFNREELIVECVKSVQEQTYKNYEHIIIDDGSDDNTIKIVEALAKKDSKIILIKSPENSGGKPGKVRNIGIKIAKGELIAFLDSDDLWEKEKLEIQLVFMQKNGLDFSYHPLSRLVNSAESTTSFWGRDCFQKDFFRGLFLSNFIPTCSVLVKKKVLKEVSSFEESLKYDEDYFLWMLIALKNYKMAFLGDVLGSFRRTNHGNINSVLNKKEKNENTILLKEKIIFEYKNESIHRLMKSDLFYKYIYYYCELIREDSSFAGKKELLAKVFDKISELNLTLFFVTELEFLARLRKND